MPDASRKSPDVIHTFRIPFPELHIRNAEIMRALGYSTAECPDHISSCISECLHFAEQVTDIRCGLCIVQEIAINSSKATILCHGAELSTGEIITDCLAGSDALAVFVATIGGELERASNTCMESGDPVQGFIFDLIGSELAELAADWTEKTLDTLLAPGVHSTSRYSPGYCGWNVADQHKLFSLLPPGFCGIALTESALMIPIKSVSGVIGIGTQARKEGYRCATCNDDNCMQRGR
jgi:hypothetical protein